MIGLFSDSYYPVADGVALVAHNYAHWLHQKGEQVCIVAPYSPNYTDKCAFPVYRYASMPLWIRHPYRLGLPNIDVNIHKRLKFTPFKLLHAHSPFSSGDLAMGIAKRQRIPLVATFHTKLKDDFMRVVRNNTVANAMVRKVMRFYEAADEVWIPQAAVEPTVREYGYKGALRVVGNGCDFAPSLAEIDSIKRQAREALHIREGLPVFLFVGQHIWEKNIRLIAEGLALIKDMPFQMFFVGTGYAANELQTLVEQLGLKEKVIFTGQILDRKLLSRYYATADLFLFPSLYDNAPLVVREAAAMHTPAVIAGSSTVAEIIIDNYNGFCIDATPAALAERLQKLTTTPDLVRKVGANAAQTIARSWQDIVDEVLTRYNQIIEQYARK